MLYQIQDGTVSLGGKVILSHIDFEIKGKEKIAVTGRNGAGKSTLLRLIRQSIEEANRGGSMFREGGVELDRDDKRSGSGILMSRKLTVCLHEQVPESTDVRSVQELLLEACPAGDSYEQERYAYELEYDRLMTGFGFTAADKGRSIASFSGGEQTKLMLIRYLLARPDLLLLDEPTNHLDLKTIQWLEDYLRNYPGAVVLVSHDRFFLDRVAEVVYELEKGHLTRYTGGYTDYREQKRKNLDKVRKAYEAQQEEIRRLEELIDRFKHKPKKAAFARSRKKILERMEKIDPPGEDDAHLFTGPIDPAHIGSKWVLQAEELKIGYDMPLLEITLRIRRGQKIGIIGENGTGKTTFLKTAAGRLMPLKGKCILGNGVETGYFDQQSAQITSELSVYEHFSALFPALTQKEGRQILGHYLFKGKAASLPVESLSGGEKSRLVLAELLNTHPNFLILDEPTNHMDIHAKETLESAFSAYTGTILFVSHDRYFLDRVADALLVFEKGEVFYYPFGYSHYLEKQKKSTENRTDIPAMVRAENQALVEGLRAVPKKERMQGPMPGTEESHVDWLRGLAKEEMERNARRYEACRREMDTFEQLFPEEVEAYEEKERSLKEKEKAAEAAWTESCIRYLEYCEELSEYGHYEEEAF